MNGTTAKHGVMQASVLAAALAMAYTSVQAAEQKLMDPTAWVRDRGGDPGLTNAIWEGRDALKLSILPPAEGSSFNNWQGHSQRTTAPAGESFLRGDIWIQSDWSTGTETDFQNTGMWGSAMPTATVAGGSYVDSQAVFPIMHFTNQLDSTGNPDGKGVLRIWDTTVNLTGGWVYLSGTENLIQYGGWNSIDLRLIPEQSKVEYYFNGSLVHTWVDPTSDNGSEPGQFFAMYLKARNNGITAFDTYWSRLMSGAVYTEGQVSGLVSGDVMVDAGGVVSVADGTAIPGSLYGNGSTTAASVVNFDKSATVGGDLIGSNTWFNFSMAADATATITGSVELENKSLASGGSAGHAIQAGHDIKLNDSTLKGYWTLPNGSVIAQGGARIEDAVITANKSALKTSGNGPLVTIRNSSLTSTDAGPNTSGLVTAVNASNNAVLDIDGSSVAATGILYTRGILATTGARVTTTNTAISTTGNKSHAVHAHVEKDDITGTVPVVVINGGTISTTGDESWGLFALRGGKITSSANITTAGKAGFGAFIEGNGESNARAGLITLNGGSITTTGEALGGTIGSFGVLAKNEGNTVTMTGTKVTTSGGLAEGLRVEDKAQITARDSTITTSGSSAHGVAAYSGGKVDLTGGSVAASGTNANGLRATGAGSKITTNGTTVTTGAGKYGALASGGGQIQLTGGSVSNTNTAPGSQGIAADGIGSSITATNVAISAKGVYTGPGELSNVVSVSNEGSISLTGGAISSLSSQFGRGILASTKGSVATSGVVISTVGSLSNAVHAYSNQKAMTDTADSASIQLMGGSITTSGEDAYGLSAQNIGSVIGVNTTGSASTAITTTGSNAYGAVAYNGATLNLKSTRISTSGAGARGISINAMSAAQTPGSLPVPNVGSTLAMTGGSIVTKGADSAGVYIRNDSSITLDGVTVSASGAVFSSDFSKSGQTQTIVVGAGSVLSSVSDVLLRVDRSTDGEDGIVNFTLKKDAFASGNIKNYRNNILVDQNDALTNMTFEAGSHWAGIFINNSTIEQDSGTVSGDVTGDVATTTGSSVTFDNVSNVAGSISTAANSTTTFSGSSPTTITNSLIGQQGSNITFNSGATINESVTGVGSTMSFGGSTTISQGIAGSGSSVSFSGPTTIGSTGGGNAITGASNTSFSFSRTAPTTITGSVDLSGGASTHGGTTSTPVTITGDAAVNSGAVLGGNLNISGTLSGSGGTIGPGNSVGAISIGSITGFGGTYIAEVNAAGQSDLVTLTSTTVDSDLRGIALQVRQENGNGGYVFNHDYTIIKTDKADGISGITDNKFSSAALDSSFSGTLVTLDPVKYGANFVKISLTKNASALDAERATWSGNQRSVMSGLDGNPLDFTVAAMQADERKDALNQLSGEVHGSTQSALQSSTGLLASTVGNRMRGNVGAGMLAGAPMADASGSIPEGGMPRSAAYPLWAEVVGNWNTLDGDDNAAKTRSHTAGIYLGGDVPVGKGWRVGGALGFTDGRITADAVGSRSDVRSYTASVYGGNQWAMSGGQLNFLAGAGYTLHNIDSRRTIDVGGSQTLKADYDAHTTQLFTELGYAIPVGRVSTIEPYVGLAWFSQHSQGFDETGGSAALRSRGQTDNITTTTLGLRGKTVLEMGRQDVRLTAGLGWRHASGDVNATRTMSFIQGNGAAFTVAGSPVAKDSAVVDLAAETNVGKNTAMGLAYTGQFGKGSTDSTGSLYLKVRF